MSKLWPWCHVILSTVRDESHLLSPWKMFSGFHQPQTESSCFYIDSNSGSLLPPMIMSNLIITLFSSLFSLSVLRIQSYACQASTPSVNNNSRPFIKILFFQLLLPHVSLLTWGWRAHWRHRPDNIFKSSFKSYSFLKFYMDSRQIRICCLVFFPLWKQ